MRFGDALCFDLMRDVGIYMTSAQLAGLEGIVKTDELAESREIGFDRAMTIPFQQQHLLQRRHGSFIPGGYPFRGVWRSRRHFYAFRQLGVWGESPLSYTGQDLYKKRTTTLVSGASQAKASGLSDGRVNSSPWRDKWRSGLWAGEFSIVWDWKGVVSTK